MAAFCVRCGTALEPNARFCGVCGTSLDDPEFAPYRGSVPVAPKTNGLATASLVLSIVNLCGVGSILAIILGFVARARIKKSGNIEKGSGLALAGIIIGFIGPVLLVLVAMPVFFGARGALRTREAQDRAAQASLRNALTAAKAIYTDHQDYREATNTALKEAEPQLIFVLPAVNSTGPAIVSSGSKGPSTFFAAARSTSGTCWYIRDVVGTGPDSGTSWNRARFINSCSASVVPTTAWRPSPLPF